VPPSTLSERILRAEAECHRLKHELVSRSPLINNYSSSPGDLISSPHIRSSPYAFHPLIKPVN